MITNVLNNLIDFKTMMNQNQPNDIIEIPGNAFLVQIVEIALTEITTTCRLNQPWSGTTRTIAFFLVFLKIIVPGLFTKMTQINSIISYRLAHQRFVNYLIAQNRNWKASFNGFIIAIWVLVGLLNCHEHVNLKIFRLANLIVLIRLFSKRGYLSKLRYGSCKAKISAAKFIYIKTILSGFGVLKWKFLKL